MSELGALLQDIVDDLAQLLNAPAVLEDTDFALVAYCSQGLDVDPVRAASILGKSATPQVRAHFEEQGVARATAPVYLPGDVELGIAARTCLPARCEGQTYGYLWVLEPAGGIESRRLALAGPLADRAGELLARRRRGLAAHERLVADLLSGDPVLVKAARYALATRGELAIGEPVAVIVVRSPAAGSAREHVVSVPGGDLAPAGRRALRLVSQLAVGGGARDSAGAPDQVGGVRAGISAARGDVGDLAQALHEADLAARVALARPALGPVVTWDQLGIYQLAAGGAAAVEALIAATPAAALGARDDPELARTALVYLDEAGHAARTAALLSVHRQTLYYRLEKIEQVTGIDLDQGEPRLQLHLGLVLAQILPHLRT